MRRCLLRRQSERFSPGSRRLSKPLMQCRIKRRFPRHLSTHCGTRCNSLAPKIVLITSPWLCKAKRDGSPFEERYDPSKYPPAKPEVLRLLAPQRGLTAIAKSKPKTEQTTNSRLPELSNFGSPP